jgi:osmotically-inducible protein OsmY
MISSSRTDRTSDHLPQELAAAARRRLQFTPYASLQNLSCECNQHGVLVLRGQLPSFYHKQLAQEAVARLEGVTQVVNETTVA